MNESHNPSLKFAALLTLLFLSVPASAHHGWSYYKTQVEMVLTVTALKLGNPHDRLVAKDSEGQEWNLLLAPPARNRRFGFTEATLKPGDEIEIFGQKHPKKNEIKVHYINIDGDTVYTYRYDGGRTSMQRMRIADPE